MSKFTVDVHPIGRGEAKAFEAIFRYNNRFISKAVGKTEDAAVNAAFRAGSIPVPPHNQIRFTVHE